MNNIIPYKKYKFNGNYKREYEDLSYTIFNGYNFSKDDEITSFFRSDFRGSKFSNIKFYKNNFDRADFISCFFEDVTFLNVNIAACEMKNCCFKNVKFENNNYNNTSIQECIFIDCTINNEQLLINMKNCSFINCVISNTRYERSTSEKIFFDKCEILSTDFANMHAERFSFVSCTLTNVNIDVCYIYGYLFYDTNIYDINIIYMGKLIEFNEDNILYKFTSKLWQQQRYYEFINVNILFQQYDKINILVEKAFGELQTSNIYLRRLEIINIFDMLLFYTSKNKFSFELVKKLICYFESFKWELFDFDERIQYISYYEKLKLYISEIQYNEEFIYSANSEIALITFYCDSDDYEYSLNIIKELLHNICKQLGINNGYELLDAQKGSWIFIFSIICSGALLLPKVIKKYTDIYFEINTKRKINKKLIEKLEKSNLKIADLKLLTEIAASSGILKNNNENLEVNDLVKLIETIKINI